MPRPHSNFSTVGILFAGALIVSLVTIPTAYKKESGTPAVGARPVRLRVEADTARVEPEAITIQGHQVEASSREWTAPPTIHQPELLSLIRVTDPPGREKSASEPSADNRNSLTAPFATPSSANLASDAQLESSFLGADFDDNPIVNGEGRVPPDPILAAGPSHLVEMVNEIIGFRTKDGTLVGPTLPGPTSLDEFWSTIVGSSGLTPEAFTFDPKVVYDEVAERFVVMSLGVSDRLIDSAPTDDSSIYLAVSDDSDPNGTWCGVRIDSSVEIGTGVFHWADFPGLAVDDEAIYLTANMFQYFSLDQPSPGAFGGVRLWIVDKGLVGGLYDCDTADITVIDPYNGVNLDQQVSLQPAMAHGSSAPGVGTFLVGYSGTTLDTGSDGTLNEFLQVLRIDDPLGSPSIDYQLVSLGDIEDRSSGSPLPKAPQMGSAALIETNDRASLSVMCRDDSLYATATIDPTGTLFSGGGIGESTALWVVMDTSDLDNLSVADQGIVDGEDIATGTHTFYASLAVDDNGFLVLGFSASGPSIYPGAYFTWRETGDAAGTNRGSGALQAGLAFYERTRLSNDLHRWGDFSSVAIDPAVVACFWAFNQFADTQGSPTNTGPLGAEEQGRWATAAGQICFKEIFADGFESEDTSAWAAVRP